MKRKLYSEMLDWKAKWAGQYSLMIEGARRVGKSYIVEKFVRQEYAHSLIIDFASADRRSNNFFRTSSIILMSSSCFWRHPSACISFVASR